MAALWVALALVGGWPDPGRSFDLLSGRSVTVATKSALVALLCWVAVVSLTLTVVGLFRPERPGPMFRSRLRVSVVLVVAVTLLVAGIAHRTGYRVCCASNATAQQAEQLVH